MIKRIVITGATSGIGRATALLLAEEGHELVLAARREDVLISVAEIAAAKGATVQIMKTDVTDQAQARQLVQFARALGTDIYPVLINCAGAVTFGAFEETSAEILEEQMKVNLIAPMHLCHEAIPWMLDFNGGQIVNVLSVAAVTPFAGAAPYCASKAGLLMLGRALSAEFRGKGIKITSVLPGSTSTELWDGQSFQPDRANMLPVQAVAEAIRDLIAMPHDRNVDELHLMPPKGVL